MLGRFGRSYPSLIYGIPWFSSPSFVAVNVVECRGMSWNVVECRGTRRNLVKNGEDYQLSDMYRGIRNVSVGPSGRPIAS